MNLNEHEMIIYMMGHADGRTESEESIAELVEMLQFIVDDDDGYSIEGIYKLIEKYKQT